MHVAVYHFWEFFFFFFESCVSVVLVEQLEVHQEYSQAKSLGSDTAVLLSKISISCLLMTIQLLCQIVKCMLINFKELTWSTHFTLYERSPFLVIVVLGVLKLAAFLC